MAGAGARGMLGVAFGITPEAPDFDVLREEFFVRYERRMLTGTQAFDGVHELVKALLARGLRWGVVTNKQRRFTEPLTAAQPLFATAGLDVPPEVCIYVGDDERDIIAGRAAGMRTVAAAYGYMGAQTDSTLWDADATITSPLALLKLLEQA